MNNLIFSSENLFITFLASILIWLMFAALLFVWVKNKRVRKDTAIRAFLSALIAWSVAEIIKMIISVPRPYEITGYSPLTATVPGTNSFPSTHSAVAAALATSLFLREKSIGIYFVLGAVGVAVGRILSNVHYIFDVIVGIWIGIVVGFVSSKVGIKRK